MAKEQTSTKEPIETVKHSGSTAQKNGSKKYEALKAKMLEVPKGTIITTSIIYEMIISTGFESKYNPDRINLAKHLTRDGILTSPSKNQYRHNTWVIA